MYALLIHSPATKRNRTINLVELLDFWISIFLSQDSLEQASLEQDFLVLFLILFLGIEMDSFLVMFFLLKFWLHYILSIQKTISNYKLLYSRLIVFLLSSIVYATLFIFIVKIVSLRSGLSTWYRLISFWIFLHIWSHFVSSSNLIPIIIILTDYIIKIKRVILGNTN